MTSNFSVPHIIFKRLVLQTGFKFNTRRLAKWGLNLKNATRKIKPSNLFVSLIFWPFYVGQSESRRQEVRRYCLCALMICNQDNVIQSYNRKISGSGKIKSGHSDSSTMYLSWHNRYIAYLYPKCCDCNVWNFPWRTFGIDNDKSVFVYFLLYVIWFLY